MTINFYLQAKVYSTLFDLSHILILPLRYIINTSAMMIFWRLQEQCVLSDKASAALYGSVLLVGVDRVNDTAPFLFLCPCSRVVHTWYAFHGLCDGDVVDWTQYLVWTNQIPHQEYNLFKVWLQHCALSGDIRRWLSFRVRGKSYHSYF